MELPRQLGEEEVLPALAGQAAAPKIHVPGEGAEEEDAAGRVDGHRGEGLIERATQARGGDGLARGVELDQEQVRAACALEQQVAEARFAFE